MSITRLPRVSIPGPLVLGSPADRGRGGGGGWISKLQATKTLIEPRLEVPWLRGRVSELGGNRFFPDNCSYMEKVYFIHLLFTVLVCCLHKKDYIILIASTEEEQSSRACRVDYAISSFQHSCRRHQGLLPISSFLPCHHLIPRSFLEMPR